MVVRTETASPRSWKAPYTEPQISESAYIHPFAKIVGAVTVEDGVVISPGTAFRAEGRNACRVGSNTQIQNSVFIHAPAEGRVVGDDDLDYGIWIGDSCCVAHMALVQGPAYIGDRSFVGFRSTVFNARVGRGCIIMMHVLVQDVEIPPNKFVASGSIITNQQQADRLPDVTESDRAMVRAIAATTEGLAESEPTILPSQPPSLGRPTQSSTPTNDRSMVTSMSLNAEIVTQVRSLLAQGYSAGIEHASKRRFKTGSWQSGGIFSGSQALSQIEASLHDFAGEYVRLIGVDTRHKRRVLEMVIQRPDDTPGSPSRPSSLQYHQTGNGHQRGSYSGVGSDIAAQVRSLLNQGCKIGTEFADRRRFKTSSWLTGPILDRPRENEVIRQLESLLAEHEGEYVRLVGIDPVAKRRVLETVVQRPGEANATGNGLPSSSPHSSSYGSSSYGSSSSASHASAAQSEGLTAESIQQIRALLSQGLKIGMEHASKRRFKTNSWKSCTSVDSRRESDIIAALEACIAEHPGEYVRVLGIDEKAKRRVAEIIVQRPGDRAVTPSRPAAASTSSYSSYSSAPTASSARLNPETAAQVRSLLAQGLQIGTEHATKRRFKTNSWHSCSPITSHRESEVIAALEACLAEHQGEYVRLLGIDNQAKRRVLETIIQRP